MYRINKSPEMMTSKQRVIRTFQFEKTDRVTIGYEANANMNWKIIKRMARKIT